VSIIIFRSIQRFFKATFRPVQDTLLSAVAFAEVASGSIGIGLLVAFCAAGVLRLSRLGHTSDSAIVEAGVFWIFSYGSFLVAEAVDLSGAEGIHVVCDRLENAPDRTFQGAMSRALTAPLQMLRHAARLVEPAGWALLFLQGDVDPPEHNDWTLLRQHDYTLEGKHRRSALYQRR